MKKQEESMQIAVSKYLQLQYPDVIFTSESSGVRLTIGQAVKAKKMRSAKYKLPDMIILEPRGHYVGMCLELKRSGTEVFKKDGTPRAGRIDDQAKTLWHLHNKGYWSSFTIGFEQAKEMIDHYMSLPPYKK